MKNSRVFFNFIFLLTAAFIIADASIAAENKTPPAMAIISSATSGVASVSRQTKESVIGKTFHGRESLSSPDNLTLVSPDGMRVAFIVGVGEDKPSPEGGYYWNQYTYVVDGKELGSYQFVSQFVFSPDSKHFAFVADIKDKNEYCVVLDGKEGEHFTSQGIVNLKFSADSKRVGYFVDVNSYTNNSFLVIDGKRGELTSSQGEIFIFSPDSKHFAQVTVDSRTKEKSVHVDGQAYGKVWESDGGIGNLIYSSDSKHLAYVASSKAGVFSVIDGQEGKPYSGVTNFKFSPDSQHYLYTAQLSDNKLIVVVDGKESNKQYDALIRADFSPDGKRVAYAVNPNSINYQPRSGCFMVLDNQEGKRYDKDCYIGNNIFSPDSRSYFSPDSKHLVYSVSNDNKQFYSVDGQDNQTVFSLKYSPDSSRIAYIKTAKEKQFVVLDDSVGKQYDDITNLVYSPNGKVLAYAAYSKKKNKWCVVINGQEGKYYDLVFFEGSEFAPAGSLRFDEAGNFHYLAVDKKQIYLVEENLVQR